MQKQCRFRFAKLVATSTQHAVRRNTIIATIHLLEGPVGAGKSTFAVKLSAKHNLVHLDLDEWMVTLFRPDRPETDFMVWYSERKSRCIEQIWRVVCELIDTDVSVVLELGLVQQADREDFYRRVDGTDYELMVYLVDAPDDVRRARVLDRNREQGATFKMEVSEAIFEMANNAWQEPDEVECRERNIQLI
jgi:predicted kinase